jgi:hypothetical protein
MVYLGIIFILSIFCSILLALLIVMDEETKRYNKYIICGTRFFCKEKPSITCQILKTYNDFFNKRLRIKVTFPSGNTCNLLTTVGAFEKIWRY